MSLAVMPALATGLSTVSMFPNAAALFETRAEAFQYHLLPRCGWYGVHEYQAAKAQRDAVFVRSLSGTRLAALYKKAGRHAEKRDEGVALECGHPLPPPPPPNDVRTDEQKRRDELAYEQAKAADQKAGDAAWSARAETLFSEMVAARDAVLRGGR